MNASPDHPPLDLAAHDNAGEFNVPALLWAGRQFTGARVVILEPAEHGERCTHPDAPSFVHWQTSDDPEVWCMRIDGGTFTVRRVHGDHETPAPSRFAAIPRWRLQTEADERRTGLRKLDPRP